jgi:nicotinamidase/pyrazinamidase
VVVDVQNDFADPKGSLYVKGGEAVVAFINAEVHSAREGGAPVVYTQDWHPPSTPHFQTDGGPWPVHCVQSSWGAAFHPDLEVEGPVVQKGTHGEDGYSGFTVADPRSGARAGTGLAELLRDQGVQQLTVVGLATDYCVKATALDAVAKGFKARVLRRGIRAVNLRPSDGDQALQEMAAAGIRIED